MEEAVRVATAALASAEDRPVEAATLEAAVLDRTRERRKFRRLTDEEIAGMMAPAGDAAG
jgi:proteasome alpha subunit